MFILKKSIFGSRGTEDIKFHLWKQYFFFFINKDKQQI